MKYEVSAYDNREDGNFRSLLYLVRRVLWICDIMSLSNLIETPLLSATTDYFFEWKINKETHLG